MCDGFLQANPGSLGGLPSHVPSRPWKIREISNWLPLDRLLGVRGSKETRTPNFESVTTKLEKNFLLVFSPLLIWRILIESRLGSFYRSITEIILHHCRRPSQLGLSPKNRYNLKYVIIAIITYEKTIWCRDSQ